MTKNKKTTTTEPSLSRKRKQYRQQKYRSKVTGEVKNDGHKFTRHRCLNCHSRLLNIEFDKMGLLCCDCYGLGEF